MKRIILCADDFGYNQMINKGIFSLLRNDRLSAVSCMTNMKDFATMAPDLKNFQNKIDLGLHFNLTEGEALTKMTLLPLSKLLLKSHLRLLNAKALYQELTAQYQRFVAVMGVTPSHIDGHQHVHHLPIIRDVLMRFIKDNQLTDKLYIRNAKAMLNNNSFGNKVKTLIINQTGANVFSKMLRKENMLHNRSFAGVYSFNDKQNYRETFLSFVNVVDNHGLIMCHPGLQDKADVIGGARLNEFNYLNSDLFLQDAEQYGFNLKAYFID